MNQPLHILRKDIRTLWPEIAVTIALLISFTAFEPQTWVPGLESLTGTISIALAALVGIGWGVLIIRLIQLEGLVGLNQFWTTRPYEWPHLLAAKGLFLLIFLYLPLTAAQTYLLQRAHLPIFSNIPALLLNLVLLTCVLVLPVVCFAALTASFAQANLVALGSILFLIVVAVTIRTDGTLTRGLALVAMAIEAAVLSAALLSQFSRRATRRAWLIFALALVLAVLTRTILPGSAFAVSGYDTSLAPAGISIAFDNNPARVLPYPPSGPRRAEVYVYVPIKVEGIRPNESYARDEERVVLIGADGYRWRSGWRATSDMFAAPVVAGDNTSVAEFTVPHRVYDRLSHEPVSLTLEFALTQLANGTPQTFPVSTDGHSIPQQGFCALDPSVLRVMCRAAFHAPTYITFETARTMGRCKSGSQLEPAHGFYGGFGASSPAFHLSPVEATTLPLSASSRPRGAINGDANLCEGTPITFVEKQIKQRLRVQMPATAIDLSKYVEGGE